MLKEIGCEVIADHVDLCEFRSIVDADRRIAHRWKDIFASLSQKKHVSCTILYRFSVMV